MRMRRHRVAPMTEDFDGRKVLWRWTPAPEWRAEANAAFADVADEYAVTEVDIAPGVMLWAKYHGEWSANPWSARPVIMELLRQLGAANGVSDG